MEQETDYILREVKRLTALMAGLIGAIQSIDSAEIVRGIKETDDFIRKEWNVSFKEMMQLSKTKFVDRLQQLPEVHLENLAELLNEIIKKLNTEELANKYNKKEIAHKGILLTRILNNTSKTYSFKRMEIQKTLRNHV